jgi:hypothetical protein
MACHLHEGFNFCRNLTQEMNKSFAAKTLQRNGREGKSFVGESIFGYVMSLANVP